MITLTQAQQNTQELCEMEKVTCVSVAAFNTFYNPRRSSISWFLKIHFRDADDDFQDLRTGLQSAFTQGENSHLLKHTHMHTL